MGEGLDTDATRQAGLLGRARLSHLWGPMAGTAVLGRVTWRSATVVGLRDETATARTIALAVRDWPGHIAGQHVDVRLTAPDGYSAVRSYSIASAPNSDGRIEITVERLANGEVSPYLTKELLVGDDLELRGPIGGWFVWRRDQTEPIQLVAGGSGIVPLMAMIRSRASAGSTAPFRLLYSVREPGAVFYRDELRALSAQGRSLIISYAYTRVAPKDSPRPPGRIDATLIATGTWPSNLGPTSYVCGPTSFVENATDFLIAAGHGRENIRTERFGATGERK
jgi:ferredoxin-NADP reductase